MSDDDDSTTTGGGGGHFYYSPGTGGTNAFRQHLAKQLGNGDNQPLTRNPQSTGTKQPAQLSPHKLNGGGGNFYSGGGGVSPLRNNNMNPSANHHDEGGGGGTPSAHIKISALKEQVSRLEEALSNTGGGGGMGGGASDVLEGKYMEVVKKNRDITVRYESERAKVSKLMRQIVTLEEKNMYLEQEKKVTLPSQQQQQQGGVNRGGGGGYGSENTGGEPQPDDPETIAKQAKKDLETANKSLVLFRKQCDEQKREIVKMRKILLKELGDEATLGRAQSAIGAEDFDDNESLAGSVAASTTTTRTAETRGGQPTWKGRAEQIQLLNMKVKNLQRKLATAEQQRDNVNVSGGVLSDDGTMSAVSYGTRNMGGGGGTSIANRDFDDVHTVMLENKAGQKRQELEDAKQTIKKLEDDLRKEKTKNEGLASRMKIIEKDSQSMKGNLQTLIGKACNDDALISSYKERLEELRAENKVVVEKLRDEKRKLKERGGGGGDANAVSSPSAASNSGNGLASLGQQQNQLDSAMLQGLRRQVSKLELQNSTLIAELEECHHDLRRATAAAAASSAGRPPSGNGAQVVKAARRRGSSKVDDSTDDDDADPASRRKSKDAGGGGKVSTVSSRFAWLVEPAAAGQLGKIASSTSSPSSSSILNGATHAAAIEAIAKATDVIVSQRAAIQFYEKKSQQKSVVSDIKGGGGDRLIIEENQYLRERIKMLTEQNAREGAVLQGNFTQLLQAMMNTINGANGGSGDGSSDVTPQPKGASSSSSSYTAINNSSNPQPPRQAWNTPRGLDTDALTSANTTSGGGGGFLPSIAPMKASTPLMTSKGTIKADREPASLGLRANTADIALGGSRGGKAGSGPIARKGTAEPSVNRTRRARGNDGVVGEEDDDDPQPMSYADAQRLAMAAKERKEAQTATSRLASKVASDVVSNVITPRSRHQEDGPVVDSDGEEESALTTLVSRKHQPAVGIKSTSKPTTTAVRTQPISDTKKPVRSASKVAMGRKQPPSPPPESQMPGSSPAPRQFSIVDPSEAASKVASAMNKQQNNQFQGGGGGAGFNIGGGGVNVGVRVSDPVVKSVPVSNNNQPRHRITTNQNQNDDSEEDDDDDSRMPTYGDETPGDGYSITPRSDGGDRDDPKYWMGGDDGSNNNGGYTTFSPQKEHQDALPPPPPPKPTQKPVAKPSQQQRGSVPPAVLPTFRTNTDQSDSSPGGGYASQFSNQRGRNVGGAMPPARARF